MARNRSRASRAGALAAMIVALAGLGAAGCRDEAPAAARPAPEVAVVEMHPERVVLTTDLPGRTLARLVAEIRPQATGLIQARLFTEGAVVEAGDVLYRIDPRTYEAACAHAEAAVAAAKANHATARAAREVAEAALTAARAGRARAEAAAGPLRLREARFKDLLADRAVSQQDYDDVAAAVQQADAQIDSAAAAVQSAQADITRAEAAIGAAAAAIQTAEASLTTARINLDYTRLTAPIGGHIGRSNVTTGALVTSHQPLALATIRQLDPIYVDVPQATADLLRLQRRLADERLGSPQASARLLLEDDSDYPLAGELQFREVSVDPTTSSCVLRLVFPNPDGVLLPGMFVRAVIEEGVDETALLVPQQAVARTPKGEPFVYVVDEGDTVAQRMIAIDRAVGNRWLVTSGLAPGDSVVVEGLQKIRPGVSVTVVPAAGTAQPDLASRPAGTH